MLARSKLNSIKSKIREASINNEISHENLITIINKEKKYRELKENNEMINSQKSNVEKINLIEEGKKIGINEVTKCNKNINNSLMSSIIKMKSYCWKCKKDTENINPRV